MYHGNVRFMKMIHYLKPFSNLSFPLTQCSNLKTNFHRSYYIPKKGRRNATQTVEATSAVLSRTKHQKLLEILSGSNSSTALASGFIIRAYFVKGLITC